MNRRTFHCSTAGFTLATLCSASTGTLPFSALGVCGSYKIADGVKSAGGSYIEENCKRFLVPEQPESAWRKNLEAAKTSALPIRACNSFLPGALRSTGKDANHEAVLTYADIAFRRAGQAGIDTIVFGSSGSRKMKDGDNRDTSRKQLIDLLKRMAPLAESQGITIALEPLRRQECNLINTVQEGADIIAAVDLPNVRLLFDIYHMLQNGETPSDLTGLGPYLWHGHIAEKEKRTAPGVAGDDFRPFFAAMRSAGFNRRLSIEGRWKIEELSRAYEVIKEQARP